MQAHIQVTMKSDICVTFPMEKCNHIHTHTTMDIGIQNGTFPIGVGGRGVTLVYWLVRGCWRPHAVGSIPTLDTICTKINKNNNNNNKLMQCEMYKL